MQTLLLLIGLLISNVTMAQSLNDTIYFNSGEERVVNITKETGSAISYQYLSRNGGVKSGRARKSILRGYAIYDEQHHLVSRELKEDRKRIEENTQTNGQEENKVSPIAGVAIVGGALVAGTVVVLVTILAFLTSV